MGLVFPGSRKVVESHLVECKMGCQHALLSKVKTTPAVIISPVIFSDLFPRLILMMKLTEALILGCN